ncbi:hypothetical protein [Desulfobacula sp.]
MSIFKMDTKKCNKDDFYTTEYPGHKTKTCLGVFMHRFPKIKYYRAFKRNALDLLYHV